MIRSLPIIVSRYTFPCGCAITFPIMEKAVITDEKKHPVYEWLTSEGKNGVMDSNVEWNFQKYLINEDGSLEKVVSSGIKPYSKEIIDWIKG